MTVSNFGDGNKGNATASFNGITYRQSNSSELDSAMKSQYGGESVYISHPTSGYIKMSDVFWTEAFQSDTNEYEFYNGTYTWFNTVSGGIMLFNKQE